MAAAWSNDGEYVRLEELPNWTSSSATSIYDKDLVCGEARCNNKTLAVVWRKGKPKVFDEQTDKYWIPIVRALPDGRLFGSFADKEKRGNGPVISGSDGKWKPFLPTVKDLPKGIGMEILDVASDGSMLCEDIKIGVTTYYRLKPIKN